MTHDLLNGRHDLLQLNSDIILSSRDSCPTTGINTNSNSVCEMTTPTPSTMSTTQSQSQTGLFDNAKQHKGMKIAHLNIMWLGVQTG